jgi:uncharacterized membrane protein
MGSTEQSVVVDVPVRTAYNQWTQFEDFARFMEAVESITQVTDTRNHWIVKIAGVTREFDTEITEQVPDERIAWKSTDGSTHAGVVTFHRLEPTRTKVMLQLYFQPEGLAEQVGDKTGLVGNRINANMEAFKEFLEARGAETGEWRGEVPRSEP